MMTPQAVLAAARIRSRKLFPYFATAVYGMVPKETPGLGTFGVSKAAVLRWCPQLVEQMQEKLGDKDAVEFFAWVLVHAAMHLLERHAQRAAALGADPTTWNLAADCEINDDLMDAGAPKLFGTTSALPEKFGWARGGLAETYYAAKRQKDIGDQGEPQASGQDQPQASGQGTPTPGQGETPGQPQNDAQDDNQDAQQPAQSDPPAAPGPGKQEPGQPQPGPANGRCGSGAGGEAFPGEDADGPGRSEADQERMRRQVAEAIKQHEAQHGQGSVPGGWVTWADELVQPPKVRWQDKLSRAIRRTTSYRAGLVDYTYSRPSRRQASVGYGRGAPIMPSLRAPIPQVCVAVDTSGSMGTEGISRAASETAGILNAVGAAVDFVACDCEVHTMQKVRSPRQFASLFRGGGGTSFKPAFEAIEKMRPRPNLIVFVTDGQGDAPAEPLAGIDTIWCWSAGTSKSPS